MTYREVLQEGAQLLAARQIEEAALDAWLLLSHVTGMDRTHYFLEQAQACPSETKEKFDKMVALRAEHIPLQHLTGTQAFMGYEFLVNPDVLIPRQDTELLVEETEKRISAGDSVLDMCTGSGCIIISLAKRNQIHAAAADISEAALVTARANAQRLHAEVQFAKSDLFENISGTFSCIVSNPPYIRRGDLAGLMPEVRDHEPSLALDGDTDGLSFYRRIIGGAGAYLRAGGWLLFEIGCDQGSDVAALMRGAGYQNIEIKQDLAGLDRVVLGQRQQEE